MHSDVLFQTIFFAKSLMLVSFNLAQNLTTVSKLDSDTENCKY